jgi:hypothetical protein
VTDAHHIAKELIAAYTQHPPRGIERATGWFADVVEVVHIPPDSNDRALDGGFVADVRRAEQAALLRALPDVAAEDVEVTIDGEWLAVSVQYRGVAEDGTAVELPSRLRYRVIDGAIVTLEARADPPVLERWKTVLSRGGYLTTGAKPMPFQFMSSEWYDEMERLFAARAPASADVLGDRPFTIQLAFTDVPPDRQTVTWHCTFRGGVLEAAMTRPDHADLSVTVPYELGWARACTVVEDNEESRAAYDALGPVEQTIDAEPDIVIGMGAIIAPVHNELAAVTIPSPRST